MSIKDELTKDFRAAGLEVHDGRITLPASEAGRVLKSVADQVNAGALGAGVTAEYHGPSGNGARHAGAAHRNPARLMDPGDLAEFAALRDSDGPHQWLIGRRVEQAAIKYAGRISIASIWREAAEEIEVSRAQVRRCHETWLGTDDDMRETFDVLTFQHFYWAVLYCKDRAARVKALRWCLESADQFFGRPAPASKLAAKLRPAKDEPGWLDLRERMTRAISNLQAVEEDARRHELLTNWLLTAESWQAEQVSA